MDSFVTYFILLNSIDFSIIYIKKEKKKNRANKRFLNIIINFNFLVMSVNRKFKKIIKFVYIFLISI